MVEVLGSVMAVGVDLTGVFAAGALLVSAAGLGMTYMRTARMQGSDRQRIKALEDVVTKLATFESVVALGGRLSEVESEMHTFGNAMTKVAVIETKVDGLDRLMTRELDEIKHSLRSLTSRSFDPSLTPPRRRPTAG